MMTRIVIGAIAGSVVVTLAVLVCVVLIFQEPLLASLAERTAQSQSVSQVVDEAELVADYESVVVDMVAEANQSVVSVVARREVPIYEQYYEEIEPFGGLFGGDGIRVPQLREEGTQWREVGGGSGFVVSADGLVVTNRHVVSDDRAEYSVVFPDGSIHDIEVLAKDSVLDIAILQIEDTEDVSFPYLRFGDSEQLQLGQTVVAIGNALAEFENSVSVGVVSGLSRSIQARNRLGVAEQLDQVIQTDAAINLGNSGGPLLSLEGEVVGVNVATSLQGENISFALPAHAITGVVQSVQETGQIVRPFLGVRYATLTERMAQAYNLDIAYGAVVLPSTGSDAVSVLPDSPAAEAGIEEGDVIRAVDDQTLEDRSLAHLLREKEVGDTVTLTVWRDGEEFRVDATLVAAP